MLIATAALALPPLFFKPAEVISATNAQCPPNSIAEGFVVLDVSLTERGQVVEVGALRDIPSLTSAATSEVQSWRFKPASQDGMVQASAMTVAFVYRPPVSVWKPPSFTPALPNPGSRDRKSTRLNSSHRCISYAVFCLKKKKNTQNTTDTTSYHEKLNYMI